MKKFFAIALAFMLSFSLLISCGGKDKDGGKDQTAGSKTAASKGSGDFGGTAVNQTKESGQFTVTVLSIVNMGQGKMIKPAAGCEFIFVKVAVKNNGDKQETISSMLHFFDLVDGQKTKGSFSTIGAVGELGAKTIDGEVDPGETIEGYFYLEAPKGSKSLELSFNTGLMDQRNKISFKMDIPK